jgi:hypothetical protein
MKTLVVVAGLGLAVSGCASTAPQTSWGKPGVSRVDYGTEVGMCTGHAAMQNSGGNGTNTAGGISGSNNAAVVNPPGSSGTASSSSAAAASGGGSSAPVSAPVPAGGTYSGMASSDFAQRAATQQRTQEMAAQRARAEALKSCLTGRGYQEFALNAEQRAHLATLKKGGEEYHEYLYQLGSNLEVVAKQAAAK